MNIEVERLRLDVLLSLPLPPPQYDLPPRRSPAAGMGLDKPGVPHLDIQQTEQEGTFLFQVGVDGFLHVDRMRISEQEGTLYFQADVEPRDNRKIYAKKVAARQEFTKRAMGRQQQGTASIE